MAEVKKTTKATAPAEKKQTVKKTTSTTKKVEKPVEKTEVKEVVKPEVKKPAKKAGKQLKVTLVKSPIGYNKKQARVVRALGLGKLNSTHVLPDNAAVRGMVTTVAHLVKMEELN